MDLCLSRRKTRTGKPGAWMLRWTERGPDGTRRRRTQAVGTHRDRAREVYAAKLAELQAAAGRGVNETATLSRIEAEASVWLAHRSDATRDIIARAVGRLRECLGDVDLIQIDRRAIMQFRAGRLAAGTAAPTLNKELRALKSVFSYAVDAGWLRANPLLRWRDLFVREVQAAIRVVEPAEFARLIAACRWADFECLISLAYYQGLRRAELIHLRWADVDLARARLTVANRTETGELTKSRKDRTVPLRRAALAALRKQQTRAPRRIGEPAGGYVFAWDDGRPLSSRWVSEEFAWLAGTAGVACTLHDLRRSFSTLAQRAGVDRSIVKDLGGWSSVSVVERHYQGEIGEAYRRATARMDRA